MNTSNFRLLSACLAGENLKNLFCASELISLSDSGLSNSSFNVYHSEQWYGYQASPSWSAIAMISNKYPGERHSIVLAMSASGAIWELYPKGPTESFAQLPQTVGLTNLASIGNSVYACGMGRLCLRRDLLGKWENVSAPWPELKEGVIGFTDLGGLNADFLYAVGWQGEIWVLSGNRWSRQDSPTNANLNAVTVGIDGVAYAVGDDGVMLKTNHGHWEIVETSVDSNLLDVCIHDGIVFVCSDSEVLRLVESGLIADFAAENDDLPRTCFKLISDDINYLYSVGSYDIFRRSSDGWERIA
jgi:hypothetical protein